MFSESIENCRCICFTATAGEYESEDIEKDILSDLGFKFLAISADENAKPVLLYPKQTLPKLSIEQLMDFLDSKRKQMPVLIWTDEQTATTISQTNSGVGIVDQNTDYKKLRKLDERSDQQHFPLLIVTDGSIMRGTDFRSPKHGICLVVTKPFDNMREAQQALARVGRFGDDCERIITHETKLVDGNCRLMMMTKLIAFREKRR